MIIKFEHLLLDKSKHSLKCTRAWARAHNIDWKTFLKDGIDEVELLNLAGDDPEVADFMKRVDSIRDSS